MGVYSRTDVSRGVHKAPANETIACTGLSVNYTTGEQDILNPAGVNLIRALPGQGIRIWGARTASSNSAFKYVNIRRLFIFVEQSIRMSTNWVVFEPNNSSLWARVQMTVSSFLESMFRAGMLAGDSPAEAQKEKMIREAEGEAEAILKVQQANADGIRMLKEAGADESVLTLKSLEALGQLANGTATKIVVPSDLQGIASLATSLTEIVKTKDAAAGK